MTSIPKARKVAPIAELDDQRMDQDERQQPGQQHAAAIAAQIGDAAQQPPGLDGRHVDPGYDAACPAVLTMAQRRSGNGGGALREEAGCRLLALGDQPADVVRAAIDLALVVERSCSSAGISMQGIW